MARANSGRLPYVTSDELKSSTVIPLRGFSAKDEDGKPYEAHRALLVMVREGTNSTALRARVAICRHYKGQRAKGKAVWTKQGFEFYSPEDLKNFVEVLQAKAKGVKLHGGEIVQSGGDSSVEYASF